MTATILEMNGDKIARNLNYIPSGRNFYNVVVKDEKQHRFSTAEEVLSYLQGRKDENIVAYIKVPQALASVSIDSLKIA